MRKLILFALINLFLFSSLTIGSTIKKGKDLEESSRTILGIIVGKHSLYDVQKKLGNTEIWEDGDAALAESKLCYLFKVETGEIVVFFASNSEMAGPSLEITDTRLYFSNSTDQNNKRCTVNNLSFRRSMATPSGIQLGISKEDLALILGSPEKSTDPNILFYNYMIDVPIPKNDKNYSSWADKLESCFEGKQPYYSIGSSVVAYFEKNRLIKLEIGRMESIC